MGNSTRPVVSEVRPRVTVRNELSRQPVTDCRAEPPGQPVRKRPQTQIAAHYARIRGQPKVSVFALSALIAAVDPDAGRTATGRSLC